MAGKATRNTSALPAFSAFSEYYLCSMDTRVVTIDPLNPSPEAVEQAAKLIRAGELVAFPTETVYGLGANALDETAVQKIFTAKGRPQNNPLIVHVSGKEQAQSLVAQWTDNAEKLAEAFWPGPLTIVLPKKEHIPHITTGGGSTVALRCPDDETALMLIETSGVPIAAPSANRSGSISPVDGVHVQKDLEGLIPLILDSGPVPGGIESTVIDLSGDHPRLLRPGLLSVTEIESVIGPLERTSVTISADSPAASPGLQKRHYSPKTPFCEANKKEIGKQTQPFGMLHFKNKKFDHKDMLSIVLSENPQQYAHDLYRALHELDTQNLSAIFFEMPPHADEWLGVRDRLMRASAQE